MKISKKEKTLLFILLILIIGAIYYFFFFKNHSIEIANLEENLENVQTEYDLMQAKIISANGLDERIKANTEKLKKISSRNYGLLKQENQTVLIKRLSRGTGLKIKSISYDSNILSLTDLDQQYKTKVAQELESSLKSGDIPDKNINGKDSNNVETTKPTDVEESNPNSNTEGDVENTEGQDNPENKENPSNNENTETTSPVESVSNERSEEENAYMNASLVDVLTATISFEGSFIDMDKYLKNIYNHEKNIIIEKLNFHSDDPKNQSGELVVSFYGVRELKYFVESDLIFKTRSDRGKEENAYIPYDTFVELKAIVDQISSPDVSVNNTFVPSPPREIIPNKVNPSDNKTDDKNNKIDTKNSKNPNSKTLDSFESFDVFFVGGTTVSGDVTPSTLASLGNKSVKFAYNFENPELINRANLVFDKNKKMIYSPVSEIGISLYTYSPLGENKMGFVVVDSTGTEHEVYLEIESKSKEWIHAEAKIDKDLVYPCMIQRVFIEGEGLHQTLNGTIYVDDLRYNPVVSE